MKKMLLVVCLALSLCGCGKTETFETISDEVIHPVMGSARTVDLQLPTHASVSVINKEDNSRLYFCDGYTLTVQVLPGGDLDKSIQTISGFERDALMIMQTASGENPCYEWVWACVGEGGDQFGRAMLVEDGGYHYCLSTMADASDGASLEAEWNQLFSSFTLS